MKATLAPSVFVAGILSTFATLPGCRPAGGPASSAIGLSFDSVVVADTANLWWARVPAELNGDGQVDLALQSDNGHGGWLGWLEAGNGTQQWTARIIAHRAPGGGSFASGDLDAGDLDGDGDVDVLGFEHPGEWDEAGASSRIYWYENQDRGTSWTAHAIGDAPDFVKDVNLADFDGNGLLDLVAITYEEHLLTIYRHDRPEAWTEVQRVLVDSLHEGMDVGDFDGDGDVDIATNGYWLENPGGDLTAPWPLRSIDPMWHTQVGDWSRNATKVASGDLNGDGRSDVVVAHSERSGYPLIWYGSADPVAGEWTGHLIAENWPAGHTLQAFDADLDGDLDVLAGVNRSRAQALGETRFPVVLFLNEGSGLRWTIQRLSEDGIYNGQAADVDGDGDMDLFRLPSHDASRLELLLNRVQ